MSKVSHDELKKLEASYKAASASTRGTFLNVVTDFEFQMEMFICQRFCNDLSRFQEMQSLILSPRVTFSNKFQIFEFLIDKYYPANKPTKGQKKIYAHNIKEIIEYRNILAHYPLSTTDQALLNYKKDFTLEYIKFKNVSDDTKKSTLTNFVRIKPAEINQVINNTYDYIDSIRENNAKWLATLGITQGNKSTDGE